MSCKRRFVFAANCAVGGACLESCSQDIKHMVCVDHHIYIYVLCCTLIYTFQTLSNLVCHYRERTRQWQGLDQVLTGRCTITSKAVRSAKVNFRTISSHGDAQGAHPVKGPIAFPFTNSIYVEAHGTNSIMVAEDLALFCLLLPYSTLTGLFLRYSPPYLLRPLNCHVS